MVSFVLNYKKKKKMLLIEYFYFLALKDRSESSGDDDSDDDDNFVPSTTTPDQVNNLINKSFNLILIYIIIYSQSFIELPSMRVLYFCFTNIFYEVCDS